MKLRPHVARMRTSGPRMAREEASGPRMARVGTPVPCGARQQSLSYLQQKKGRVEQPLEPWVREAPSHLLR
jgi:hypothetical protein